MNINFNEIQNKSNNDKLKNLAEQKLNISLFPSSNILELINYYNDFKEHNYIHDLLGYKPDFQKSICNIHNLLYELSLKYKEVIVFGFDAISFEYYLSDISVQSKNQYNYLIGVLSTIFPSTTSAAWPSIITGTTPSEHGIYGTSFLHEDYNQNYVWLRNKLCHKGQNTVLDCDVNVSLTNKPTIFQRLCKIGVDSYFLGSPGYGDINPLRTEITNGSIIIKPEDDYYTQRMYNPQALLDSFMQKTEDLFIENPNRKLIFNYIDFDEYIHRNGYNKLSETLYWDKLFSFFDKNKSCDRVFVCFSDHGQIEQQNINIDILSESEKANHLAYNTGGAGRVLYFYPQCDNEVDAINWINKVIGNSGTILKKSDLIKYGLLDSNAIALNRIGEYIAIAQNNNFP